MEKNIKTEIRIQAPIEQVWQVLTDVASYPEWNPFIESITGNLQKGGRLAIRIGAGEQKSSFKPKVLTWEPPKHFVWEGSLPVPGLFVGRHEFHLSSPTPETTHLLHQEFFRGLLSAWILKKIGEQTLLGFQDMNEALKERCEAQNNV